MATTSKAGKTTNGEKMKAGDEDVFAGFDASEFEAQIDALKAEIAKLSSQLSASGERSFDAIKNMASEGMDQMRVQGEEAMRNLRANAGDIEAQLTATVREKPVTALAVAAGVGFLFALLARR